MKHPKSTSAPRGFIAVIDPAVRSPELQSFNALANASPIPLHYHMPALHGMNSLLAEPLDGFKGIIILGSLASVNDELPWQVPLVQWLKQQWDAKVPTLGICFGHQLIAKTFGGKVGFVFEDQHKITGTRQVNLVKKSFITSVPTSGNLATSHCEEVKEIPKCLEVLAQSPEVKYDGLAHKDLPIWSFQPHPEALLNFFIERKVSLSAAEQDRVFSFGHGIINDFLNHCARAK